MMLTNRTPRSTIRRASRQLVANERNCPGPPPRPPLTSGSLRSTPYSVERGLRFAARDRSAPARPTACGRPARSWRCGWRSPDRASARSVAWFTRPSASSPLRCSSLGDAGRVLQVQHRLALVAEQHAGVDAGQKAALPQRGAAARAAAGGEHDVARQVLRLAAQAVGQPRAHAGQAERRPGRTASAAGRDGG